MSVRDVPERGACRVPSFDRSGRRPGDPVRDVELLWKVPCAPAVLVVAHAVHELLPGIASIGKEELVIIHPQVTPALFGQKSIIESDAIALRIDVELAYRGGLIAAIAKASRESW